MAAAAVIHGGGGGHIGGGEGHRRHGHLPVASEVTLWDGVAARFGGHGQAWRAADWRRAAVAWEGAGSSDGSRRYGRGYRGYGGIFDGRLGYGGL